MRVAQSAQESDLALMIRILRRRRWIELVQVALTAEMRTLAAHVRSGKHDVGWQFVLDIEVPLLHVGPNHLVGKGNEA